MAAANSEGLRVATDQVSTAAEQMRTIADELREGLQALTAKADDVAGASWRGQAATAFRGEWDKFHDAAKAIVDDADTIADLVAYSVKAYDAEDEVSAAVLRSTWGAS